MAKINSFFALLLKLNRSIYKVLRIHTWLSCLPTCVNHLRLVLMFKSIFYAKKDTEKEEQEHLRLPCPLQYHLFANIFKWQIILNCIVYFRFWTAKYFFTLLVFEIVIYLLKDCEIRPKCLFVTFFWVNK